MLADNFTNTTSNFDVVVVRIPCISKTLLEMHTQSIIDFSQYEYLKVNTRAMPWPEIIFKIAICMLSIILAFVGNVITIYSMLIKPFLKKHTTQNHEYFVSNVSSQKQMVRTAFKASLNTTRQQVKLILNENERDSNRKNSSVKKIYITKLSRPKRPKINYFILNLCFCDLMIVIWCSWVHMINSVSENWRMGAFFCRFNTYVQSKTCNESNIIFYF